MRITPKSDKEIAELGLWPVEGSYSFKVLPYVVLGGKTIETLDTVSKSGNEMIRLVLEVYNMHGESKIIIDYLLESMYAKLKSAAKSCGILDKYDLGEVTANDFINKHGAVKLRIEKDKEGQYPDRNAVDRYLSEEAAVATSRVDTPAGAHHLDDIPFDPAAY